MLRFLLFLAGSLMVQLCVAQKNYGVSQDYYIYQNQQNFVVPMVYYETKNNWYASLRYNYEEDQTFSFQVGKFFLKEGTVTYSVTPLAGVLAGKFKGFSISAETEINAGKFSFFTAPEFCFQLNTAGENFFYNWSELSIQPNQFFYSGLALQTVKSRDERLITEPGVILGITIKNFEIPFYFFKPSATSHYLVVGIHWFLDR